MKLVNVVGWEVACCDGPLEMLQMKNLAIRDGLGTEGLHFLRCHTCQREYSAAMTWREVIADDKRVRNAESVRIHRAKKRASAA